MTITQVKNLIVGVLQGWFPNKKVLDKLNEVNGKLYYNGIEVSLNSLTEEDVQQAIQTAIAELTNIKYTQDATNKYLIKLNQQLQTKAMTDELTGLYNRRYALEKLKQLIKNYNTNHTNFSLAITDIDFFKKFNDSYGHDTGDFVLISNTITL